MLKSSKKPSSISLKSNLTKRTMIKRLKMMRKRRKVQLSQRIRVPSQLRLMMSMVQPLVHLLTVLLMTRMPDATLPVIRILMLCWIQSRIMLLLVSSKVDSVPAPAD